MVLFIIDKITSIYHLLSVLALMLMCLEIVAFFLTAAAFLLDDVCCFKPVVNFLSVLFVAFI